MAVELFEMAVDTLGVAVGSAVNLLDLELVVFAGGPAAKLGQDLADRIGAAAGPWMLQLNPDLAFVASSLGDDAGVAVAVASGRALAITG